MTLQYLSDDQGQIIAVQIPIAEWEDFMAKHPEVDLNGTSLPTLEIDILDTRLKAVGENPKRVLPIEDLFAELDRDVD